MNEYITHGFPFLFLGILPTVLFAVRGVMDLIVPQSELFLKTVENLLPLVRFFFTFVTEVTPLWLLPLRSVWQLVSWL